MLSNFLSPCIDRRESESLSTRRTVHKITTFEYPSPAPSLPHQPTGTLIDTSSQPYRVSQRLEQIKQCSTAHMNAENPVMCIKSPRGGKPHLPPVARGGSG